VTGAEREAEGTPLPEHEPEAGPADLSADSPQSAVDETRFAHASEAEMARILDFYDVRWEYEPQTFPILWNLEGDVVESFAPDFYLSEVDLYVEMTTLRQKLVRKKNRKLRRLRELYPDVQIKLFYARDFRALMLKYGKLAIADGLTGAEGQVVPPDRPVDVGATVVDPGPESDVASLMAGSAVPVATSRETARREARVG
jgi:hypoxanthine phosphoribosyltransferase